MATSGPVNVLDSGRRTPGIVIRDRLTRRQSPARYSSRSSVHEIHTPEINSGNFYVDYRIPQPYRTSFSATHSVEKKPGRSRSLSPASSLRSGRRKPGRSRSKSPKRVTYSTRVTVRHSDTEDSMFTELSSHECETSPNGLNRSQLNKLDTSVRSADSGIDYSSQLRDISQQIYKMDWSPHNTLAKSKQHRHGILKDKQNTVNITVSPPVSPVSPESSGTLLCSPGCSVDVSNKENSVDSAASKGSDSNDSDRRRVISKEYSYDRTVSYRIAMQEQGDVKHLGEEEMVVAATAEDSSPDEKGVRKERSNTMPTQNLDNGHLSPMKKSVSSSISNFFRKISPRLGRKHSRHRDRSSGSACSLDTSDGQSESHDGRFSRSKVRRSFLKIINRSKSRSKSRDVTQLSPKSKENDSFKDANPEPVATNQQLPQSTNRMMKSIELSSLSDKQVYSKFKEMQSPKGPADVSSTGGKPFVARPIQQDSANESGYNSSSVTVDSGHVAEGPFQSDRGKPNPPKSLDVLPPRAVKALQSSIISSTSGDESIGECSLDVNFTASEPSLLSSKQPVISRDPSQDTILSDSISSNTRNKGSLNNILSGSDKENAAPDIVCSQSSSVASSPWDVTSPSSSSSDPSRKPSYLRISCAVSGYGRYAQYSSYTNIEKRSSPFSSTSSLRSFLSSPDMPSSVHSPGNDDQSSRPPLGHSVRSPVVANGQGETRNGAVVNGHVQMHPTGDSIKDGEYFLTATQMEEERLQLLCDQAEAELKEHIMSDEVSGRLRAAIGKGNLLRTRKFQQFRDLCSQHMHPDVNEKETKWEDLRGFWDMVKIQIDSVDDLFAEIAIMRHNGWKEIPKQMSRRSSASSSPKSGSQSQGSTPSHTPGSKRRGLKTKDTPESSPERVQKARQVSKARDDARKQMLAEKRAAMKQQQANREVEIYASEDTKK